MADLPILFKGKLKKCNDGQQAFFDLVCDKVTAKEPIEYCELKRIWQENVRRKKMFMHPCYDHELDQWKEIGVRYTDYQIEQLVTSWALRTIGSLVKKGYLTVIPRIQLSR